MGAGELPITAAVFSRAYTSPVFSRLTPSIVTASLAVLPPVNELPLSL